MHPKTFGTCNKRHFHRFREVTRATLQFITRLVWITAKDAKRTLASISNFVWLSPVSWDFASMNSSLAQFNIRAKRVPKFLKRFRRSDWQILSRSNSDILASSAFSMAKSSEFSITLRLSNCFQQTLHSKFQSRE